MGFFSSGPATPQSATRLLAILKEAGLQPDGRKGNSIYLMNFRDPKIGHQPDQHRPFRQLEMHCADTCVAALLVVHSRLSLPFNRVGPEIPAHLLARSGEMPIGGWVITPGNDGNAAFAVKYFAFLGGMGGAALKHVINVMCSEVHKFEARLLSAGLLDSSPHPLLDGKMS